MKRIAVCITGATWVIYGIRLLEKLASPGVEIHLVLSKWAMVTMTEKTAYTYAQRMSHSKSSGN